MDETMYSNTLYQDWDEDGPPSSDEAYDLALRENWLAPLDFPTAPDVEFPVEALPRPVANFVGELCLATQTPLEMGGILSLGLLATLFQDKYTFHITNNWTEPLCLYTMAIAPPAERKSAVLSLLTAPVREYEHERYRSDLLKAGQEAAYRDVLAKRVEKLKASCTKGDNPSQMQELSDAVAELSSCEERHPYRILVDDATPEKLAVLISEQPGGITVCSAEGGVFDSMMGRYDSRMNLDVYLKGHAGDTLYVDRIGRETLLIPSPRLSMMLAVQPDVLGGVMRNRTMRGRGLTARFLYAVCDSQVGRRSFMGCDISERAMDEYHAFVRRALESPSGGELILSDSEGVLRDYSERIEQRLGSDLAGIQDWGGKLVGAILRIAALLHASNYAGSDASRRLVTSAELERAVRFSDFLTANAKAAYGICGDEGETAPAKYMLERMKDDGRLEFTKTDVLALTRGRLRTSDERERALSVLETLGYLRKGRRPGAPVYLLNPLVHVRFDD